MTAPTTIGPAAETSTPPTVGPVSRNTRVWIEALAARVRGRLAADERDTAAPAYGSQQWHALPAAHPLRFVALFNAAEAWRHEQDDLPRQLEADLSAARWARERIEAEQFAELAAWVRRTAGSPTHDELLRRRSVPTRPAGYQPRPWHTGETA